MVEEAVVDEEDGDEEEDEEGEGVEEGTVLPLSSQF